MFEVFGRDPFVFRSFVIERNNLLLHVDSCCETKYLLVFGLFHIWNHCEVCGVEIGIRRLEARPTATQCIDCKTLDEIREKQRGN